ncbi:MAG: hypothetical protein IKZ28_04385, partial [Clostridia bacterium]|nr:hypothetical protein [Clostridia bacterium]
VSYCISIDQSKINQEGPIAMTSIVNAGKGYIYFYVTPRHTVEYYEMFATSNSSAKLKYSYDCSKRTTIYDQRRKLFLLF